MEAIRRSAALVLALCGFFQNAFGWDATGHRAVALIAYERLTSAARARVDRLLELHPDYASIFLEDAPADPALRARYAFLMAATWPDILYNDPRFYDPERADSKPTPLLPGFPDMQRHRNWHYMDIPIAPDGAPAVQPRPPDVLSELRRLLEEIAAPPSETRAAYDLPWILHLVGDSHQPLHVTSRFLKAQPNGDAGGNFVIVEPGITLHKLWDDSPGVDPSDDYVARYAREVTAEFPAPGSLSLDPKNWTEESFELDKSDVYTFGLEIGSRENPLKLPAGYAENARRIARKRIAAAGYRLAAVLNERFR